MTQAASRPVSPTQDLWSSILDSVSKTRSIPSKQILLLGEPQTGKSTIAAALLQKQLEKDQDHDDFALGYGWADVRDEADEDMLARLSVYTVQSSNLAHLGLVPQVLSVKASLHNTLVMILLDWTKPWTFVEQLENWLIWVDKWTKGDGSREMEVTRDEGRERLQFHFQHYAEPTAEPLPITTATMADANVLPLPHGTLTNNSAGMAIVVVCTKADLIDENSDIAGVGASGMGGMVKGKGGEWEERTDGVMQVLRTICLKYGAALFYTSPLPATVSVLRQYALHFLCAPNPPQPAIGSSDIPAPARNPFPFKVPANVLDRDRIVIPAGWDSYGKISILREGFQPARWADAYDMDLESLDESNPQPLPEGARAQFSVLVGGDRGPPPRTLPTIIQPTPEQGFLQQHYETLAKDPTRDPRATFKQPVGAEERFGGATGASGVVGPMGSSSFSLPSVEKALVEMEGGGERHRESVSERERPGPTKSGAAPRRESTRAPIAPTTQHPSSNPPRTTVTNPTIANSGGRTEHEVLHHFFQSLLTKGASKPPATGTTSTTGATSSTNRASSGTQTSGPATERDRESERAERERQGDGAK